MSFATRRSFAARCVLALTVSFELCACVSTKTVAVNQLTLRQLHGGTIVSTVRGKPSFSANTAGKAAFGMIGAFAAISAGNAIIRDDDVADPAVQIAQALQGDLAREYGLNEVHSTVQAESADPVQLAKEYAGATLVLDVQTINWSFWYFPTDWSRYRVMYSAKLRLIDTRNARLIAEGFCARMPAKTADTPTRPQLLDNRAAGLKQQLASAADYCIRQFREKALRETLIAGR